jgi:hypothetical protein
MMVNVTTSNFFVLDFQVVLIMLHSFSCNLTGEIEEHLHILEELAPDWISKKVHGGDILYRQVL